MPKERNLQKTKTTPKDSFDAEIAEGAAYKQSEEAMNHKTFADTCKTFADTRRKGDCQLQIATMHTHHCVSQEFTVPGWRSLCAAFGTAGGSTLQLGDAACALIVESQ